MLNLDKEGLILKIQDDFAGSKYTKGIFVVPTLSKPDIEAVIESFISWCNNTGLISDDNLLDLSSFVGD